MNTAYHQYPHFLYIEDDVFQLYGFAARLEGAYYRSVSNTDNRTLTRGYINALMSEQLAAIDNSQHIQYSRHSGYECSSKGDVRFSAFNAMIGDLTIEGLYQGKIKGYDPTGRDWRSGKGKPALNGKTMDQLWTDYYNLWQKWCVEHRVWMMELMIHVSRHDYTVRDSFASTPVNQARALAQWLRDNPWDGHSVIL